MAVLSAIFFEGLMIRPARQIGARHKPRHHTQYVNILLALKIEMNLFVVV